MKKLFLNLFVVSGLLAATSCSSDDDSNSSSNEELSMVIDGETIEFNTIDVDEYIYTDDGGGTDYDVTATIDGNTSRIIEFGLEAGDTGADAIYYFDYVVDGVAYYAYNSNFVSVVSVNDGTNITATFSGTLTGYNEETQEETIITITNGSVSVDF